MWSQPASSEACVGGNDTWIREIYLGMVRRGWMPKWQPTLPIMFGSDSRRWGLWVEDRIVLLTREEYFPLECNTLAFHLHLGLLRFIFNQLPWIRTMFVKAKGQTQSLDQVPFTQVKVLLNIMPSSVYILMNWLNRNMKEKKMQTLGLCNML